MFYDKMKRLSDNEHLTSSATSHAHIGIRDENINNIDCFFRINSCHNTVELHPVKDNLGKMSTKEYIAYAKKLKKLAKELNNFANHIENNIDEIDKYFNFGFEVTL